MNKTREKLSKNGETWDIEYTKLFNLTILV